MSIEERPVPTSYPDLDVEMPALVRAKDWSQTSLGAQETWSPALRQVIDLILSSGFPMALRWGPDFVLIYNDGYKPILGDKHPWALGLPAREAWSEVWPQIEPIHLEIMGGERGAPFAEDMLLRIKRRGGQWEDAHFTLSYSPTPDPTAPGGIGGILVTAVETTEAVHTRARMEQVNNRLAQMFEQGPSFMAVLEGPEYRFELANAGYMRLVGDRPVLGRTVAEALPEAIGQGFLTLLDRVFQSGEAFSSVGARFVLETPGGPAIERFLDFIYQPLKDVNGGVTGIFVEGVDVTARKLNEVRREALVRLTDELRTPEGLAEISYAAGEILGKALGVSRVGYGTVDSRDDSFTVERDWNAPGVESIAGVLNLRDFGSFVDDLKAGRFIAIPDVRADERTTSAAAALEERSARSFVNVPVVENDETVAVLYVNHAEPKNWSDDDLAFIREFAARVRTAIERERASEALRRSETRLRELNEQLERRVGEALAERKLLADIVESTDAFIQVADLDFNLPRPGASSATHAWNRCVSGRRGISRQRLRQYCRSRGSENHQVAPPQRSSPTRGSSPATSFGYSWEPPKTGGDFSRLHPPGGLVHLLHKSGGVVAVTSPQAPASKRAALSPELAPGPAQQLRGRLDFTGSAPPVESITELQQNQTAFNPRRLVGRT
jgi:PAS domain-containing protein